MKAYFTRLFDYDRQMNLLISDLIIKTAGQQKAAQLMAHLLAAQQVWLARCTGGSPVINIWPEAQPAIFAQTINDNHSGWVKHLDTLENKDFEALIHYKNTKGESFANLREDIISHTINHGTHHRAQIGQLLAQAGVTLPYTDYIVYLRQL